MVTNASENHADAIFFVEGGVISIIFIYFSQMIFVANRFYAWFLNIVSVQGMRLALSNGATKYEIFNMRIIIERYLYKVRDGL
jgi:hypothetical protein